jgi:hypothetical protein
VTDLLQAHVPVVQALLWCDFVCALLSDHDSKEYPKQYATHFGLGSQAWQNVLMRIYHRT